jgi:EAL domain-containing protein (putative c-di-GMP-specific phosphodiesterase class I)
MAMYRAKAAGRNGVCFFDPAFQAQAEWRVHMESDVRQALRDNDLQMWLQPQFNGHRQVVGAEALVRWPHARRGWVSPAEFIPVAEAAGLIVPLGEWMLAQACAQLTRWAQDPVSADWTLSVNVSARQFRHPEFIAHTVATLQDSGANPQRLRLELTESMLLDDVVQTVERMEALRALGVGFSLDDFGTGYSSLTYLKRLPFLELKVDQSFVRDMLTDPSDAVLTHTMIVLAHALGLTVLAEGVETQAQLDALQADGCDLFQGFLLGRPVAVTEFQRLWVESGQG